MEFYVDSEKCTSCGFCVEACPVRLIEMEAEQPPVWIDGAEEICENCGHCVAVCPTAAVALSTMTPSQCPPVQKELFPRFDQMSHSFRSRRSTRAFKDKRIDKERLEELFAASSYSATGMNLQTVNWLVVSDNDISELADISANCTRSFEEDLPESFFHKVVTQSLHGWDSGIDTMCRNAPAVIIAHSQGSNSNCLIALTQLSLLAPTLGMGTCWAGFVMIAAGTWPAMREFLNLPEGHTCYGAMMVGYPSFPYPRLPLRNKPTINWR